MKRQKEDMVSRVYAYRCASPIAGMEALRNEWHRQRELWNTLVDIERTTEKTVLMAASVFDPEIARLVKEIDDIDAKLLAGNLDDNEWKTIRRDRKKARGGLWKPLNALRKASPEFADIETAAEIVRRASVIRARQATDALWCNYNRVIEDYDRARKGVRQFGRELRHIHRDRDYGSITIQITGTKTGLGAAPNEISDGTCRMVSIGAVNPKGYEKTTFRGIRRKMARVEMEMRIDRDRNMLRLPVVMHRPLPEFWRVKSVSIQWRGRPGRRTEWQLTMNVSAKRKDLPKRKDPKPTSAVARMRVELSAEKHSSMTVLVGDIPLSLSNDWMCGMDRVENLQSAIDDSYKRMAKVCKETGFEPFHSADRLAQDILMRRNSNMHMPPNGAVWYKLYKRWNDERIGLRDRLLRQRRENYRLYALQLANSFGKIEIESPLLAVVAQAERAEERNSLRQRAGVSILIDTLKHMCGKHGVVVEITSAPLSPDIDPNKIRHISRKQRAILMSARKDGETALTAQ